MAETFTFTVKVTLEDLVHQHDREVEVQATALQRSTVSTALKDHIRQSVQQWGGQLYPGHVLWSGNVKKVTVTNG